MIMTEKEILQSYRLAKSKKKQVSILADLNCCSKEKILNILYLAAAEKKGANREWTPTKNKKN